MDEEIILTPLSINFYRKSLDQATLVFKWNYRVYRCPTLMSAMVVVGLLKGYELNLQNHMASNRFVFRVNCVKDKHRIIELNLRGAGADLKVQEVIDEDELKICFAWEGSRKELAEALEAFRKMASRVWY